MNIFKNKKLLITIISLLVIAITTTIISFIFFYDGYDYIGKEIYKGVYYEKQQVTLKDGKNVNTFIITVSSKNKNLEVKTGVPEDKTPLEPGLVETVYNQAISAEMNGKYVIAAINADYFNMGKSEMIQPCSVTIKDGALLVGQQTTRWDRNCFFGIKEDGKAVLGNEEVYRQVKDELYQAVGGGPWLVKEGAVVEYEEGGRHPRTAVGILENGSVLFMVADGRSEESDGFDYPELAEYMKSLGCVEAINLDGGGSTTMIVKDLEYEYFETVNDPSDGEERPVGNTLLVIDKTKILDTQ